jgi:hypothetical protein
MNSKMKKWSFIIVIFIILFSLFALTNPTESDYNDFQLKKYGELPLVSSEIELERINFIVFSTYTPFRHYENGITHLGIMGKFIRISDGQFDYPTWLEFFN